MTDLQTFNFNENQVRTITIEGEPWFVATDVLKAMNSTTKVTDLKAMIEGDLGKGFVSNEPLETKGGEQTFLVLSEPAVTLFLSRSRTELGKAMNRWIHSEVLPSIRKTGSYSLENLSPARQIIKMGESMLELEQEQARQAQEQTRQAKQLEETTQTANEAKEGLENVRDELASLKEFAVAQPEGLNQDKGQLINEAFQKLGNVFRESGEAKAPDCYKKPWNELGIKMRNSSVKYDLNSRFSNAMRKFNEDLEKWEANGKPRGQKPEKPTRITILMRDSKLTDAFKAAQQVVKANISQLTALK
jgi:prophage antirepressor-like protein